MGRVNDKHSYQVKNTFVELVPSQEDADYLRGQRAMSDCAGEHRGNAQPVHEQTEEASTMPMTPSPFMHPCAPPGGVYMQPYNAFGDGLPPIVFGEHGSEESYGMMSYEFGNMPGAFVPGAMQYDPCSGTYMAGYDWCMTYDNSGYPMMDVNADMGAEGPGHTEALMAALSDKIAQDKSGEEASPHADGAAMEEHSAEAQEEAELHATAAALAAALSASGSNAKAEGEHQQSRSSRRRGGRDRGGGGQSGASAGNNASGNAHGNTHGGNNSNGAAAVDANGGAGAIPGAGDNLQSADDVPANFTTVMFRNIPNKYTREMLVNQLEQEMRGLFDFVYLPIDFKNKCNVGYAFINFRSVEACMSFVSRFNGVEVRKCLPGLNSRKVTEVTPARVQGFDENVQRLRNSPVMRELASKPEWMPLIFDDNGEQLAFPVPERPLDPIKPRRRARDEEAYFR